MQIKYWEIVADRVSKAGWTLAGSQRLIAKGGRSGLLTHIGVTERFVVRGDEKLTAFVELQSAIGLAANCLDGWRDFSKLGVAKPI